MGCRFVSDPSSSSAVRASRRLRGRMPSSAKSGALKRSTPSTCWKVLQDGRLLTLEVSDGAANVFKFAEAISANLLELTDEMTFGHGLDPQRNSPLYYPRAP